MIKFVQISSTSNDGTATVFALDEQGQVWFRQLGQRQWTLMQAPEQTEATL